MNKRTFRYIHPSEDADRKKLLDESKVNKLLSTNLKLKLIAPVVKEKETIHTFLNQRKVALILNKPYENSPDHFTLPSEEKGVYLSKRKALL